MWNENEYRVGALRIQITDRHVDYRGEWVMHCRELGMSCVALGITSHAGQELAQKEAISRVRGRLQVLLSCLPAE